MDLSQDDMDLQKPAQRRFGEGRRKVDYGTLHPKIPFDRFSNVSVPIKTVLYLPKMQINHIISVCLMPGPLLLTSSITAHRTAIKAHQ